MKSVVFSQVLLAVVLIGLAVTSDVSAQVTTATAARTWQDARPADDRRVTPAIQETTCEGCPSRHPVLAIGEVVAINVFYNLINRVLPTDYRDDFVVGPDTWARNIGRGFTWDNDPFLINQFGHPYMGGNFFSAGRANGLSFWESIPLTAAGSLMWEWLGERNHPAWNDLVNTTMGGAAFGEVLGRIAWLARDPGQTGRARGWREAGAAIIDPIGGVNRFARGDALRPGDTPATYRPDRALAEVQVGTSWKGDTLRARDGESSAVFGSFALAYGVLEHGPTHAPFDAFTMAVRVGGGATVSAASIRGRLTSRSIGSDRTSTHQVLMAQDYGYRETPGFLFGEQTLLGGLADRFALGSGMAIMTTALAGVLVLGTIDSPTAAEDRAFDYGSGVATSATARMTVRGVPVLGVTLGAWWMHTFTREPADHLLSVVRLDGRIPLATGLHIAVEAERTARSTSRRTGQELRAAYPELRAGLAWRFGR